MSAYRSIFTRGDYHWPSGMDRAAATFSVAPETVTERTGIAFESGVDDLDYFRAAGVELPSGRRVVLVWYERSPVQGLVLEVDAKDDPAAALLETMAALKLEPTEVSWTPDSDAPAG